MRTRYRHSPQGTHRTIAPSDDATIDRMAQRIMEGLIELPGDPDIHSLIHALEDRDDVAIKRLLRILKKRYADSWDQIGPAVWKVAFPGRRKVK